MRHTRTVGTTRAYGPDILESLELGGYIKRFPIRRSHRNYPILISRFQPTSGAYNGMRLNAAATKDWRSPVYESCQEHGAEHGAERAPIREGDLRKEKEKKPRAAKPAAPADPRFQPFLDLAYRSFEARHGQRPTWSGRDFKSLKALLGKNKNLAQSELEHRWSNYLASTEVFTVKQGCSLAYFCSKFDAFISGPIMEKGKPDAQNAVARTIAASPLDADGRLKPAIVH